MKGPSPVVIGLILALVAIVAFFVLGVAVGARQPEQPAIPTDEELDALAAKYMPRKPLSAPDVSGPCKAGDSLTIPAGGACVVEVAASDERVRRLRLPEAMHATWEPRGPGVPVEIDRPANIDAFEQGGTLTLRCDRDEPCVISVAAP